MTDGREPRPDPPRWSVLFLRCVVPCETVREAIFGDLHEEFVRDVEQVGVERARTRYRNRAIGIVAHAVWDSFRWRTWATTSREWEPGEGKDSGHSSASAAARVRPDVKARAEDGRRRGRIAGRIGLAVVAGVLVAVGIFVNTAVFATVDGAGAAVRGPVFLVLLGAGSMVFMLACATAAAVVLCRGVRRWLSDPPVGAEPVSPPAA